MHANYTFENGLVEGAEDPYFRTRDGYNKVDNMINKLKLNILNNI